MAGIGILIYNSLEHKEVGMWVTEAPPAPWVTMGTDDGGDAEMAAQDKAVAAKAAAVRAVAGMAAGNGTAEDLDAMLDKLGA